MIPFAVTSTNLRVVVFRNFLRNASLHATRISGIAEPLSDISDKNFDYPPIVDMSPEGQNRYHRQVWYDSIKSMPTVEEKLYELSTRSIMQPDRYTFTAAPLTYNAASLHNYITRTHLIEGLPDKLLQMQVEKELSEIRNHLNDAVLNFYCNPWLANPSKKLRDFLNEKDAGTMLAGHLIAKCFKKLASRNDYVMESTIQHKPRIESFWWHGGFKSKENDIHEKNLIFAFSDTPAFVVRTKKPLSPVLKRSDPLCSTSEVADFHYHPKTVGIKGNKGWLTCVPGHWCDDPFQNPFLLVYSAEKLNGLLSQIKHYDLQKIKDSLGVMASFGHLNAVATYHGFTPYQDLTYPLVTQTILTNGRDWNFFVYQLNTIAFHEDVDQKDHRNICWSSGNIRLFDSIENGQLKGINDKVYELLLKFLLNTPGVGTELALKPYVGEDGRTEEERENMRYFLRRMYGQIPEQDAHKEEIPTWVQIYKLHPDAPPTPYIKLE